MFRRYVVTAGTRTARYHDKVRLREIITNVINCIVIAAEGLVRRIMRLRMMIMTRRYNAWLSDDSDFYK